MEAYIQTLVDAKVNARVAELSANVNRGPGAKPSKPSTYDGHSDPELWLYGVDLYFAAASITVDFFKISFADALLRDDALIWRRTIDAPTMWDEWKALIISAFQPINPTETARDRLARLRQTASVRAYASIFRTVTLLIPTITDDEKKDRFIRGLKPKILNDIKVKAPATFDEAVKLAVRLDSLDTWRPSGASNNFNSNGRHHFTKTTHSVPMELDAIASVPAGVRSGPPPLGPPRGLNAINNSRPSYRDVTRGSTSDFNSRPPRKPLTDREREDLKKKGMCFKCRKPGHLARECPEASNYHRQ
jgi:hypothetical protein